VVSADGQFSGQGLGTVVSDYKGNIEREIAELATIQTALGQDFSQKDELALTRENHSAVMRELKRMQDEPGYVSAWEPKTAQDAEQAVPVAAMRPR
jgi:pyruvate-formate lyase